MSSEKYFLINLLKRYRSRLAWVFVFSLLAVVLTIFVFLMIEPFTKLLFRGSLGDLNPISSFFIAPFISWLDLSQRSETVMILIFVVLGFYLFKSVFTYLAQWIMASIRSDLLYYYRNILYKKILLLPLEYFSEQKRGDVVSRAVSDTQEIEYAILSSLKSFLTEPLSALFYVVFLFLISPKLTLISLLLLPLSFLIIGRLSSVLRRNARTAKQRMGAILSHVEETLSGMRVIVGFNAQRNAMRVFEQINSNFTDTLTKIYRRAELASPLSEFFGVTIVMVILVIGGSMVLSGEDTLSAEMFITYIALFTQVITPVKNLSTAFANYKRGLSAIDRIDEILNADVKIKNPKNPIYKECFEKAIVFDDITFGYHEQPVISHISLTISKESMVALVGPSGGGKSTLIDLLERFYDPWEGSILLDGIDIRQLDLQSYRSLFALVSQDVVLFNDTLYNNITMGKEVTEADVMRAVRVANIEELVNTLPNGLQYRLADRGLNLSGGQRQRISIARAVLCEAPIILLDEATSAMDTESEHLVHQALETVFKDRTVLVVAHSLFTIRQADMIVVIDNGGIVEQGTHHALVERRGVYFNLLKIQNLS